MEGVEIARIRVRELSPLIFCFDIPLANGLNAKRPNLEDPGIKTIQEEYKVQVNNNIPVSRYLKEEIMSFNDCWFWIGNTIYSITISALGDYETEESININSDGGCEGL